MQVGNKLIYENIKKADLIDLMPLEKEQNFLLLSLQVAYHRNHPKQNLKPQINY